MPYVFFSFFHTLFYRCFISQNSNLFSSDTPALPTDQRLQYQGMSFVRMRSTRATGWVLTISGHDTSNKLVSIGFDYSNGIYCYYDSSETPVWNINKSDYEIHHKRITGTTTASGELSLVDISSEWTVLTITILSNAGRLYAIPRQVQSGAWYAVVFNSNGPMASESATLEVYYIKGARVED